MNKIELLQQDKDNFLLEEWRERALNPYPQTIRLVWRHLDGRYEQNLILLTVTHYVETVPAGQNVGRKGRLFVNLLCL